MQSIMFYRQHAHDSILVVQTILLFHLNGPTSCANGACPDGFHYWFDFAAETEFEFLDSSDFDNVARSCEITRGGGSTRQFFAVTSFVTPPRQSQSELINTREFLEARIDACSAANGGLDVNLMYIDFWSIGDLPEVVQMRNKALVER